MASGEMSKGFVVRIDGIDLAYYSEVTQETTSEDKPVKTIPLGLAGFSDGAEMSNVTLKSAVPIEGREQDFKEFCRLHVTKTFSVRGAGKTVSVRGRFMSVRETSGVDNPNEVDIQFSGKILRNS